MLYNTIFYRIPVRFAEYDILYLDRIHAHVPDAIPGRWHVCMWASGKEGNFKRGDLESEAYLSLNGLNIADDTVLGDYYGGP